MKINLHIFFLSHSVHRILVSENKSRNILIDPSLTLNWYRRPDKNGMVVMSLDDEILVVPEKRSDYFLIVFLASFKGTYIRGGGLKVN